MTTVVRSAAETSPPVLTRSARPLAAVVRAYRLVLSPLLGRRCRYLPTCSEYALDALHLHGAGRGSVLALRRIGRCHPFHAAGYDPVPPARPSRVSETGDHAPHSPRPGAFS